MTETFFISENERKGKPTTRRVLFVDDDQEALDALKTTLLGMRAGWDMTFVTSGKAAIRKYEEGEFDVIVTDMHMPEMNGFELASVLRCDPRTAGVPIIGISSAVLPEAIERGKQAGLNGCIAKFDRRALIAALKQQTADRRWA